LKALFDLDFRTFVTPTIIKVVYVLIMVLLGIGYIAFVVAAFSSSTGFGIFTLLILGPLFVLIYLIMVRAGLESLIAQIRTAENTSELVRLARGNAAGGYGQGDVPQPPNNPYQQ